MKSRDEGHCPFNQRSVQPRQCASVIASTQIQAPPSTLTPRQVAPTAKPSTLKHRGKAQPPPLPPLDLAAGRWLCTCLHKWRVIDTYAQSEPRIAPNWCSTTSRIGARGSRRERGPLMEDRQIAMSMSIHTLGGSTCTSHSLTQMAATAVATHITHRCRNAAPKQNMLVASAFCECFPEPWVVGSGSGRAGSGASTPDPGAGG